MEDPFLIQRSHAAELFIVRHADAIPEADEIIPSGIYDDLPLSRLGREQALALAERLGSLNFDALYSSPLRRCLQTAAPLAERLEALSRALQERQADIVRLAGEAGHWDAIPDSEPSKSFRGRVVEALDEIARNHIGQRVLAFAHGGVVNAYVAEVLGLEKDFFYPAANTSITVVRVSGKRRVLFVLNDLGHLKRPS